MTFPGAQSSLRGYRLQHLYAIARILGDDSQRPHEFQLEGTEDLEVFDEAGRMIEAIQVKARSSPLTPSALISPGGESFFRRAVERLKRDPGLRHLVVSFGDIGPSLESLASPGSTTNEQQAVLEGLGVPANLADTFRARFELEKVNEGEVERTVLEHLAAVITCGNPQVAFLCLSGWMYQQMEKRRKLTASDVRDCLLAVGRFIADAEANSSEWFTTIEPLEERAIGEPEHAALARDFYEGVSARFEHILAGVDVARSERLTEIDTAFKTSSVVVVHGASGQGKTALACRYLLTATPSAWRFRVRELQDVSHAQRVSLALRSHAKAIGVPMIVWLDVAPQDTAWTRVVEDLETLANTRVLVTIREEDWTRARNAGATLRYIGVDLTLQDGEAREVFVGLQRARISPGFLDFEDAWRRFGGAGPLMEFTYFVTRGDALVAKLEEQVRRLREDVRTGRMSSAEIELLRRVAVSTAAGGRARLKPLVALLQLPDPAATVALFEREYLIRVSADRTYAEGLHPLRSTVIARLLTEDELDPSLLETAIAVLPVIAEADLESFLLSLFTQPSDHDSLKAALFEFMPKTWSGGAAVVRALLWCGIHEYASENAELIAQANERGGEIALTLLDPPGLLEVSPFLVESLERLLSVTPETREWYEEIQSRKPSNARVSRDASKWLSGATDFDAPVSPSDWAGMAELLFWLSAWKMLSAERAAAAVHTLSRSVDSVSLDDGASVVFSLSFWDQAMWPSAWHSVRRSLLDRFQVETRTFAIVVDIDGATAHYVVSPSENGNLHDQTIRRLDLMRHLMPGAGTLGAQAYGHIFGSPLFQHDPSKKRSVPAGSFPIPWATRLGRVFSLVVGAQARGVSWGDYAATILKLRNMIVMLAGLTTGALRKYFNQEKPQTIFELGVDKIAWYGASVALGSLPKLPQSTVDDWGFEIRQESDVRNVEVKSEHADWEDVLKAYTHSLAEFIQSSTPYFLANCHIGRPTPRGPSEVAKALKDTNFEAHLATHQLAEVLRSLRGLQKEYRLRFLRFNDPTALEKLEASEQAGLWTLWAVWYQFAETPKQQCADARRESLDAVATALRRRRVSLKQELGLITEAQVAIHREVGQWKNGRGLWLTMDVEESGRVHSALQGTLERVVEVLRPPSDLHAFDRYVLDLVWGEVHIVPLVRGRSLARTAWSFRIAFLPQAGDTIKAWELIERNVDDLIWDELKIDVWPTTVGGAGRRLQTELAAAAFLTSLLQRLEEAPEPDVVGKRVLLSHWNSGVMTIAHHLAKADAAAAGCPQSVFQGEISASALGEYCDQLVKDLELIEPLAFEPLRDLNQRISNGLVGAVAAIAHAAIDLDLAVLK
jgi:hypothetical protein